MRISKVMTSRDNWKEKAKRRRNKIRSLLKTIQSQRTRLKDIDRLKKENLELQRRIEDSKKEITNRDISNDQKTLCIFIIIFGIVSFRSVPRLLKIFQPLLCMKIEIPHFTSVIHWTLRAGLAIFDQVTKIDAPWVAIIDCSIDIGTRKALVVLRVPLNALQNLKAVGLEHCECIGIEISHIWNGQLVFEALNRIFSKAGAPLAILKDGGTDLNKGVRLYRDQEPSKSIFVIDDIGHYAANALKALFAKSKLFIQFLKIISKGASRIRQTQLAWLLPPKIRTKGRFQGITKVATWAKKALELIGQGQTNEEIELKKLRNAFAGLSKLRPFLMRFCATCTIIDQFLKLLKNNGLNKKTYIQANKILEQLSKRSLVRVRLSEWLEKHIEIYKEMNIGEMNLLVSSDIIESLFGKFKTIIQRNPNAELNRLVYLIPLLCGTHSISDLNQALKNCSHTEMTNKIETTLPLTLRQQRSRNLKKLKDSVPKTENLYRKKPG